MWQRWMTAHSLRDSSDFGRPFRWAVIKVCSLMMTDANSQSNKMRHRPGCRNTFSILRLDCIILLIDQPSTGSTCSVFHLVMADLYYYSFSLFSIKGPVTMMRKFYYSLRMSQYKARNVWNVGQKWLNSEQRDENIFNSAREIFTPCTDEAFILSTCPYTQWTRRRQLITRPWKCNWFPKAWPVRFNSSNERAQWK